MIYFRWMKLQFWTIGKHHEHYVRNGIDEFTNRIRNYYPVSWTIIHPPKNAASLHEIGLKQKEGELVLGQLQKNDFLVALDAKGKQMMSHELGSFLQQRANESQKQVIFLIGGAYGIDEAVLKRANFVWSLSLLTFPHQLVRLILSEQVYRACTILRNEKYHHS